MDRLDAMDPETHPAGSLLMDDFGSTQPTPLEKDTVVSADFYRMTGENTMTVSTVSIEDTKDGGTSYSGKDSFETVVEKYRLNSRFFYFRKFPRISYETKSLWQDAHYGVRYSTKAPSSPSGICVARKEDVAVRPYSARKVLLRSPHD